MQRHDENGTMNPGYVLAISRAAALLSEASAEFKRSRFKVAATKAKEAATWMEDLSETDDESFARHTSKNKGATP